MRIVPFLLIACLLGACAPKPEPTQPAASEEAVVGDEPTDEADSEDEAEDAAVALESDEEEEPLPDETAPITYEDQLAFGGDVFFHVRTYGQGKRKLLVVQAMREGKVVDEPAKASIVGDVVSAVATDLDGDGSGEILVFARGRSERRQGVFAGYAFVGERFMPLALPDLDRTQAKGYRGGDAFRVEANRIIRSFPVFEGASDAPTARTRTIRYALQPDFAFSADTTDG